MPDVPATPLPGGFGTYCSSTDSAGNWALGQLGPGGDPCGDMAKQGVGGDVKRCRGRICRRNAPCDPKTCINPRCAGVAFDRNGQEDSFATTCSSENNVWDCNQQAEGGPVT